ncbi:MAG: hypothetical protein IJT36_03630 [Alphaproteobacteria bacterium]|nr:hypothetical protein [Alphaproteobacteria bacterium]
MTNMNKQTIYGILNETDGFSVSDNYTWTSTKCRIFWNELVDFAFHKKSNCLEFNELENQFLAGAIMTFENEDNLSQLIFGQDKFITIILLLISLREKLKFFEHTANSKLQDTCFTIDRLIHGLTRCGVIDKTNLRISVEKNSKESDLLDILLTGKITENSESLYAQNYRFFQNKINRLTVAECCSLPNIILYKCSLLHIESDSKEAGISILESIKEMK